MTMRQLITILTIQLFTVTAFSQSIIAGKTVTMPSALLQSDRQLQIHLPPDYQNSDKHYPTLYVLDGQWYFLNGVAIQQALRGEALLPEMIIIGVDMPLPQRNEVFNSQWAEFQQFINSELVPYIDSKYRTNNHRVLFGWENSAFAVSEIIIAPQTPFSGAILSNGGYIDPEKLEALSQQNIEERYLYIANSTRDIFTISYSNEMAETLKKASVEKLHWEYKLFNEEIHESLAYLALYHGLRFYYHNYGSAVFGSVEEFNEAGGIPGLKQYYRERGDRFGLPQEIDESAKNSLIFLAWKTDDFSDFQLFMTEFADVLSTPRYANAYWQNRLGQFYLKHKDYQNAITFFESGVTRFPDENFLSEMYSGLGTAYSQMNEKKLALKNIKKAIQIAEQSGDDRLERYKKQLRSIK